jgi:hypothetical protein
MAAHSDGIFSRHWGRGGGSFPDLCRAAPATLHANHSVYIKGISDSTCKALALSDSFLSAATTQQLNPSPLLCASGPLQELSVARLYTERGYNATIKPLAPVVRFGTTSGAVSSQTIY